jgi:hypothetical protein
MTWKIVIEPHKKTGGIMVKTLAAMNDERAEQVSQAIEAALSGLNRKRK